MSLPHWQLIPCNEWHGETNRGGYGIIRWTENGTRHRKSLHRITWEAAHGPIPPRTVIMHKCDNRRCYELMHLQSGTHKENMADMVYKGRSHGPRTPKAYCKRGHAYTPANTYTDPAGNRQCRTCRKTSAHSLYLKTKATGK